MPLPNEAPEARPSLQRAWSDSSEDDLSPKPEPRLDAGNKHHDHYARRLPRWRNSLRKVLIPIVRWETPYLALLQEKMRTPALDSYFAYTANLGTHTFFMVFLPILFWCGYTNIGRAMIHMLAFGIFFSGFLKDLLCLPRPLSPPLYRITMSGSAALEYGFPSSHSTNALSVAVYTIAMLRDAPDQHPYVNLALQCSAYFYAVSIVFGRLYCGMHGFLDVIVGSGLGVFLAMVQVRYGEAFDFWITNGSPANLLITILVVLVLVRIHPEPADDCPCFDDSVAFMGVVIGASFGAWHYARTPFALDEPIPGTVPFDFKEIGIIKTLLRILIGIVFVFIWRAVTKPVLFKILPPIFRVLEHARLNLPRAFFLNASKYKSVPRLLNDDNIIPPASELPHMLKNLAHPRKRSVSVGPQSAADAYETLAYRNRRRRESMTSQDGNTVPEGSPWPSTSPKTALSPQRDHKENSPLGVNLLPTPLASRVQSYEHMMGTTVKSPKLGSMTPPEEAVVSPGAQTPSEAEQEKRELFMQLAKPRVRYDVEVVTKLVVYAGIGWMAIEVSPIFFEVVGLGLGVAGAR